MEASNEWDGAKGFYPIYGIVDINLQIGVAPNKGLPAQLIRNGTSHLAS